MPDRAWLLALLPKVVREVHFFSMGRRFCVSGVTVMVFGRFIVISKGARTRMHALLGLRLHASRISFGGQCRDR